MSEQDEVRAAAERLLTPTKPPIDPYQTTIDIKTVANYALADRAALEAEVKRLRRLVYEHHAGGAMEGLRAGMRCPVCALAAPAERRGEGEP